MTSFLRALVPPPLVDAYRRFRRGREQRRNLKKSAEEVFTEIYLRNEWGGVRGEFHSGEGTTDETAVNAYVAAIEDEAVREGFEGLTFVDLGCGDFRVGARLRSLSSRYIGVDIVKPLVEHDRAKYGDAATDFAHLDIVRDELPDGDVCFLRQVLQHLSNDQIAGVLRKLGKYRWVYITEHYPSDNARTRPNLDKVHGKDVRIYDNSGVYLLEPPFSLPQESLRQVLEVPGVGTGERTDAGVIRTFLYKPRG